MKRVRQLLEAAVFAVVLAGARLLPRRLLLGIGALAGSAGHRLDRRHREIGIENLRAAFGPALSEAEAARLSIETWRHFGRITVDTLLSPAWSREEVMRIVAAEGVEHLREAHARGKGVVCFGAHFGHWELAGLVQGYLGFPLALVARPLDNPYLERMLARIRQQSGNLVVHKRQALRDMIRAVHRGMSVAILIDQDAHEDGVFVPFFGRPASTTPAAALLALRTGAALLPVYCLPETAGGYRIVYESEIPVEPTGDRDADVLRLTRACTERVEAWVREHPSQWLWMHRRWKTQPREAR